MTKRVKDLHIKSRAYAIQKITRQEKFWQNFIGKHQCEYCSDGFRTQRQLNLHSVKHRNAVMSTRPRRVAGAKKPHATSATYCLRLRPLVSSYSYPVKSHGPKETKHEKRMCYLIKKRRYLNGIKN